MVCVRNDSYVASMDAKAQHGQQQHACSLGSKTHRARNTVALDLQEKKE